jgi:murein L,D-transpeptidase YcbB/YkuD
MRKNLPLLTFLVAFLLFPFGTVSAQHLTADVARHISERIQSTNGAKLVCRAKLFCGSSVLPRFYANRFYAPAWIGESGPLPRAFSLVAAISEADRDGLKANDYHLETISALLHRTISEKAVLGFVSPDQAADLDLLLTDTFLIYASHLLSGRVNPETLQSEWFIKGRKRDLLKVLEQSLEPDAVKESLADLSPPHSGYVKLKTALSRYRDIVTGGGWPLLSHGPVLRRGDYGDNVRELRAYLLITGDLVSAPEDADSVLFDKVLESGVRRFQTRHGLKADGVVGPTTRAAMDVSAEDRLRQIEVNMERWRWLPADLGDRYVQVNIAGFTLSVIENNVTVLSMRAIVGKDFQKTPVFSGLITNLNLNPYWNIPDEIARKEILPEIRRKKAYLARNKIRVYIGWGQNAREIRPSAINWSKVSKSNFPFQLRQDPGPKNPLGSVKFVFPNKYDVYIHGTPYSGLFEKESRGFSHGCIRIESPVELADFLLREPSVWNSESLIAAIETKKNRILRLPEPTPVHILYFTTWVDEAGTVHFRDDVYGHDAVLSQALGTPHTPVSGRSGLVPDMP